MEEANRDLVRDLLADRRVLALSVLIEEKPFVGQLPFAARSDFGALFVHASRLARHTRGLTDGAPFSALIQVPETAGGDPFQMPRLTLTGVVRVLTPGTDEYDHARAQYLEKLPSGKITFSLGDFVLFALIVEKARLVAGFGRTANLTPGMLRDLQTLKAGGVAAEAHPVSGDSS